MSYARSSRIIRIKDQSNNIVGVAYLDKLYSSILLPEDTTMSLEYQIKSVLNNIDKLLEKFQVDMYNVIYTTIYYTDRRCLDHINSVWDAWVPWHNPPARENVYTKLTNCHAKLGVSLVASIDKG